MVTGEAFFLPERTGAAAQENGLAKGENEPRVFGVFHCLAARVMSITGQPNPFASCWTHAGSRGRCCPDVPCKAPLIPHPSGTKLTERAVRRHSLQRKTAGKVAGNLGERERWGNGVPEWCFGFIHTIGPAGAGGARVEFATEDISCFGHRLAAISANTRVHGDVRAGRIPGPSPASASSNGDRGWRTAHEESRVRFGCWRPLCSH